MRYTFLIAVAAIGLMGLTLIARSSETGNVTAQATPTPLVELCLDYDTGRQASGEDCASSRWVDIAREGR